MIREWDLRPLRVAAVVLAVVVIAAMNFPPTKYARTTWCGYPARVDRWTRLTHQEQVHLGWQLAPGVDPGAAGQLCASCHRRQTPDLSVGHTHHVWVQPGVQTSEEAPSLLLAALQHARPRLEGWDLADMTTDPRDGSPVLVLWLVSQATHTPGG
jgi:hypothetical protein